METVKVIVTVETVSGSSRKYNVNNLNELINELKESDRVFCLMYGGLIVFHSMQDITHDHELKDNYTTYTIVYLMYNKDLIFKINLKMQ